jgi:hypothetical protein
VTTRAAWIAAIALAACTGQDKAKPAKHKKKAAVTQEAPPAVAAAPVETEPPLDLPAGHTPGDLLPPLPTPAPRLGRGGDKPTALYPNAGCADLAPQGFALVRTLEVTLPPKAPGELPGVLEACVFQKPTDRKNKAVLGGRSFQLVAAWPGDNVQALDVEEAARTPHDLPQAMQDAGHDASAWGTLISTGWPDAPVLAVLSARFYDGPQGQEVHWLRDARLLRPGKGPGWQAFEKREFTSLDLDVLRQAVDKDPTMADRLAEREQKALDQLALRAKRLKGAGEDKVTAAEPDPQAIWLRDGRKALQKGDWKAAIELALRVDAVCAEPTTEAHAVLKEALQAGQQTAAKVQPAQATVDLCEPLPDKPAPRRKPDAPKKADRGERAP